MLGREGAYTEQRHIESAAACGEMPARRRRHSRSARRARPRLIACASRPPGVCQAGGGMRAPNYVCAIRLGRQ